MFMNARRERWVAIDPDRLVVALLSNLDVWIEDLAEIERNANPGNKVRVLHLQRNMLQCKISLQRILGEDDKF